MTPKIANRIEEIRKCVDGEVLVVRDEGARVFICVMPRVRDKDWQPELVLVDPRNWRDGKLH